MKQSTDYRDLLTKTLEDESQRKKEHDEEQAILHALTCPPQSSGRPIDTKTPCTT